ncbi:hypothetical protein [Haloarchaeobius sp. DFWS5]|uniref:hypothetical protein n=1 Tax=Haloarchaeobius sp. DFWS5 TaxID=3446114 RepID=UPI003EB6C00D
MIIDQFDETPSKDSVVQILTSTEKPLFVIHRENFSISLSEEDEISGDSISISYPSVLELRCDEVQLRAGNPGIEWYLELVETITRTTDPDYVFATHAWPDNKSDVPTLEDLQSGRIPEVHWLNVFSTATVNRLGREEILSAPAWEIRETGSDHIMVVSQDSPANPTTEWKYGRDEVKTALSEAEIDIKDRTHEGEWSEASVAKWLVPPSDTEDE